MNLDVLAHDHVTASEVPFEAVERKGRGHPDTICDLIPDNVSRELQQFYLRECGRVLHYNLDKALLIGWLSRPCFGGGTLLEPAKLYLGDRAIGAINGQRLDLGGMIEESISSWLNQNLRYLRLNQNLTWKSEIHEGAAALNSVEDRGVSNDTSVGVGFWPLSPLEQMILAVEEHMNIAAFKQRHPASGEDIKVMAVRRGHSIAITIACAMIGRYINSNDEYVALKGAVRDGVVEFLHGNFPEQHDISVALNALDDPTRGAYGLYLTVTGLSCEGGDSGQVGRGNRVNGLISFLRPQTMEAWAGKNPTTHIGKIYSFAAQALARRLTEEISQIKEANIVLVGRIGAPVSEPADVFADLKIWGHCHSAVQHQASEVLKKTLREEALFSPKISSRYP